MPSIANPRPVVPEENNFWANQTIHGDIEAASSSMYYDPHPNGYRINKTTTINILPKRVFGNSFLMNDTNIWMRGDGSPRLKSISELQNIHDRNKDMSQPAPYSATTIYPSLNTGNCEECVEMSGPDDTVSFDATAMYSAIRNGDGIVMLDPNATDLEVFGSDSEGALNLYGGKFGYINGILTKFLYDERLDDSTSGQYWSRERTIPGFGTVNGGMRYFESSDLASAASGLSMNSRGSWFTATSSARINSIPAGPLSSWAGDNTSSFAESFCSGANFIGSGFNFTHSLDRTKIYMRTQMCTGSRIWNVPKAGKLYIVGDYTHAPDGEDSTIRWQSAEFNLPNGATNKGDTTGLDCYPDILGDRGYYYSHEYIDKYNLYSSTIKLFSGSFGYDPGTSIGYDISFDSSLEVMYTISSSRHFDVMTQMTNAYWQIEEVGGYWPQGLKWSYGTASAGHIDQNPQTGLAHAFQGPSGSYHNTWSMHMSFDEGACFLPIPLSKNWNIFTTHSNGTINTSQSVSTTNLFDVASGESWLEDAPTSAVSWKNRGEETYTKRPNCACTPITEWFNRPLTATHRNTSSVDDEADDIINWVYTLTFSDGYVFSCGAFLRLLSFNPLQTNASTKFPNSFINNTPNIPMPGSENWPKDITTRTAGRLYSDFNTHFANNADYSNPNIGFIRCGDTVPGTTKTGGFLYLTDITRQNPSEYMYHYNVALDEYQFKITGDGTCDSTSPGVGGTGNLVRKSQLMPHGTIINTDWPKEEYPTSIFTGCVMIENGLYVLFEGGSNFSTEEQHWTDKQTILDDIGS